MPLSCPSIVTIQQYLLRQLDQKASEVIDSHMQQCERCVNLAASLLGDESEAEIIPPPPTVLSVLPEAAPVLYNTCVKFYCRRELVFWTPLDKALEIGRQREGEPPPYCRLAQGPEDRVVVAALQQTKLSRRHLRLVELHNGQIEATSLTSKGDIMLNGNIRLALGDCCQVLPASLLQLGEVVIRLEAV